MGLRRRKSPIRSKRSPTRSRSSAPRGRARTMERRSRCKRCAAVSASSDSISGTRRRFARHSGCIGPVAARHRRCLPVARHHRSRNSSTTRGHNPGPFVCRRLADFLAPDFNRQPPIGCYARHHGGVHCGAAALGSNGSFSYRACAASASVLALFVILGQAFAWHTTIRARRCHCLAGSATAIALIIATLVSDPLQHRIDSRRSGGRVGSLAWPCIGLALDHRPVMRLLRVPSAVPGKPATRASGRLRARTDSRRRRAVDRARHHLHRQHRDAHAVAQNLDTGSSLQLAASAALAIGGGLRISHGAGNATILIGIVCLSFGAICYLIAFSRWGGREAAQFPRLRHICVTADADWRGSDNLHHCTALDRARAWRGLAWQSIRRGNTSLCTRRATYVALPRLPVYCRIPRADCH